MIFPYTFTVKRFSAGLTLYQYLYFYSNQECSCLYSNKKYKEIDMVG